MKIEGSFIAKIELSVPNNISTTSYWTDTRGRGQGRMIVISAEGDNPEDAKFQLKRTVDKINEAMNDGN